MSARWSRRINWLMAPATLAFAALHAQPLPLPFGDGFEAAAAAEPANLIGITSEHNAVRAGVITVPALAPLAWSPALAATAQAWASQCIDVVAPIGLIDHNPGRSSGHPYYVGENIYASSGAPSPPASVVALWAAESVNYNHGANSCAGVCGHYTQLVWRATTAVGCARSDCPGLAYRYAVVCNYGPGGNTGGRPY